MNNPSGYLIDTQSWLWWHIEPERLSVQTVKLIEDASVVIYFSVVSAWEILIKHDLGKLKLPLPPSEYVPERLEISYMEILSVQLVHVLQLETLPYYHKDPFDRLLIAQAMAENLAIITSDRKFREYEVRLVEA